MTNLGGVTESSTAHLRYGVQTVIDDARQRMKTPDMRTAEEHIGRAIAAQLSIVPEHLRTKLIVNLLIGAVAVQIFGSVNPTEPDEDLSLTPPDVDAAREWIRAHRAERGE